MDTRSKQQAWLKFEREEAFWIDTIVRPLVPKWLAKFKRSISLGHQGYLKLAFHFLIDYFYIGTILRIRIKRGKNDEIFGGRGFRPGHEKVLLKSITTRVTRAGKEIGRKDFGIGIYY